MIHVLWGRDLKATPEAQADIMAMQPVDLDQGLACCSSKRSPSSPS